MCCRIFTRKGKLSKLDVFYFISNFGILYSLALSYNIIQKSQSICFNFSIKKEVNITIKIVTDIIMSKVLKRLMNKQQKQKENHETSKPESKQKLCKIVFSIEGQDFELEIYHDSDIKELASRLTNLLEIDVVQFFEQEIHDKMQQLYE